MSSIVGIQGTPNIDFLLSNDEFRQFGAMGMSAYAKRALIAFLKDFYRDPENTGGRFVYIPSDESAANIPGKSLKITDRFAYDQDVVGGRPALVVARRSTTRNQTGMMMGMKHRSMTSGIMERESVNDISFDVTAYAREGEVAEILASLTYEIINSFAEDLRRLLKWHHIASVSVGAESMIRGADQGRPDITMVPVAVRGQFRVKFIKTPQATKLALVEVNERAENSAVGPVTL